MDDKKNIEEIARRLFKEADSAKDPQKEPSKPRKGAPTLSLVVNHGSIVNGGQTVKNINKTVNNTVNNYHSATPVKPIVIVQTGVGAISAEQKHQITLWVDAAEKAGIVRVPARTRASIWAGLKKHMKVNKYDEILATDFEKAKKWLLRQAAIPKSMPSAAKKMDSWRNSRISAIHARCKEKDFGEWRISHMKAKFNVTTMVNLSDQDLETLYRTVMGKK